MKKLFAPVALLCLISNLSWSKENDHFPRISGSVLSQLEFDRILSSKESESTPANNSFVYIETRFNLEFNNNWSVKTEWRIQQNDSLTTRNSANTERYRSFLSSDRGIGVDDLGLIIEQLKVNYKNEDLEVSAGKYDPTFGVAHNKAKRIGVFTSQFTEDYNIREKLGVNFTALLERSKINISTFFNDTTGLSESALNNRGRESRGNGVAGNTGTFSSYVVSMEGHSPFGIKNWNYNLGFRSLGVDNKEGRKTEKGYVLGSEYLIKTGESTYIIPFIELVKINNFTGIDGRDANYRTIALIARYSSWIASISNLRRDISTTKYATQTASGRQMQLSVGYKFTNNLTVDVSRSNVTEDGKKAGLFGVLISYLYRF